MNRHHDPITKRLADLLGWASLGLGATQLAAPRAVCRLAGLDDSALAQTIVPIVGLRELLHAALLLGVRNPIPGVWSRVAGDAMDLTVMGRALVSRDSGRRQRATAATAVLVAITAVDLYAATRTLRRREGGEHAMELHAAITINRPRREVYRYWHDFTNLPRFMAHLESVEVKGKTRSHWKVRGPVRWSIEWDAEIVEDLPDELIAWQSMSRADVPNAGAVHFADAPGERGTELRVNLAYDPPAGKVGAAFAKLLGEHPEQQVRDDLRRLKQVMEAGEVVRSEGSPEGAYAIRQVRQRPAQPLPVG
ncbi:Polyketide cyclase / dehydrase and lipid transport [Thermomonospora echinospora]|uniref:Polyketide cyclase / dehydrase and lipid transport n=1 Tax=Thermomonospora echinospora TaxID=1992 RepID=A0A1H6D063_9ACTN|nr:SRPBCC family protein [Thermomonospora echinospora]SEG78225.1 Polyketide cyclase / dehydrase and lipid transport [Thermomonospora echinospora]